jgi:hypothetical protein
MVRTPRVVANFTLDSMHGFARRYDAWCLRRGSGIEMATLLTEQDFTPHVGKVFRPTGQHHALTLVTVDAREQSGWKTAPRKPFSLILRGPTGDVLPQGYYRFAIDDGPSFDLYIMPIHTSSRDHQDYQVVFN